MLLPVVCAALLVVRAILARVSHVNPVLLDVTVARLCERGELPRLAKVCAAAGENTPASPIRAAVVAVQEREPTEGDTVLFEVARAAYAERHAQLRAQVAGTLRNSGILVVLAALPTGYTFVASHPSANLIRIAGVVAAVAFAYSAYLLEQVSSRGEHAVHPTLQAIVDARTALLPKGDGVYRTPGKITEPDAGLRLARVYDGADLVAEYPLPESGIVKIGRAENSHLRLDHPTVARMHAVLEVDGDDIAIIDLGSPPGLVIAGNRVNQAKLSPGTRVRIGALELVLSSAGVPAAPEPPAPAKQVAPACVHCGGTMRDLPLPDGLASVMAARACVKCKDVRLTARDAG